MALPMLFSSCSNEEEDVFGKSSSERLHATLQNIQSVLLGAENGCLMDYYYGENYEYGGLAYFVKFEGQQVTASSELHSNECTSYYRMTTDNGPVLSFDTYNEVLHDLATPSQTMPEGYHADFEFTVIDATPELVTLRGKRTNNICYLRPFNGDKTEYVANLNKVVDELIVSSIQSEINGISVFAELDLDDRQANFLIGEGADATVVANAFTYTDKGIRLCHPVDVGGMILQDFAYDVTTEQFTALETANNGLILQGHMPQGYVRYEEFAGEYYYQYLVYDEAGTPYAINIDVKLVPSEDKKSYIMKGFSKSFDVVLPYNRSRGCLTMSTQAVGTKDGNTVYLQAANFENGLAPGNPDFGMMTQWDQSVTAVTVYKWVTIPNDYFAIDAWCLWMLNEDGESAGQLYNDPNWTIGDGENLIMDIYGLIKK